MYDTHCHLTGDRYEGGVLPVLDAARDAGLTGMISVAIDVDDAVAAASLAEAHADVWCTAGVHPSEAGRPHEVERLAGLMDHPKCVAWGEMGLDGHWPDPALDVQRPLFEQQLNVIEAFERDGGRVYPIVLHSRKAVDDVLRTLEDRGVRGERCVFHCFTEGPDVAERVLAFGASISLTGVVTYRNAAEVAAASDIVPLDRLMVETDSPYLTPEPLRGTWPNQPANVVHVADFLALRRGMEPRDLEAALDATARAFFGLPEVADNP